MKPQALAWAVFEEWLPTSLTWIVAFVTLWIILLQVALVRRRPEAATGANTETNAAAPRGSFGIVSPSVNVTRLGLGIVALLVGIAVNVVLTPAEVVGEIMGRLVASAEWADKWLSLLGAGADPIGSTLAGWRTAIEDILSGKTVLFSSAELNSRLIAMLPPAIILATYLVVSRVVLLPIVGALSIVVAVVERWVPWLHGTNDGQASPPTFRDWALRVEAAFGRSVASRVFPPLMAAGLAFLFASYSSGHRLSVDLDVGAWLLDPFAGHRQGLWVAVYIATAEALGFALVARRRQVHVWAVVAHVRYQDANSLEPLFRKSLEIAGGVYASKGKRPVEPSSQDERDGRQPTLGSYIDAKADPALMRVARGCLEWGITPAHWDDTSKGLRRFLRLDAAANGGRAETITERPSLSLAIKEPLHPIHFDILFAIAEKGQSEGKMMLVIAPHARREAIVRGLEANAGATIAGKAHRILDLDVRRIEQESVFTIVVVSDRMLERRLLGPEANAQLIIGSIGTVVALEATELHVSQLRFQLERLWLRIARSSVDVVLQASGTTDLRALTSTLFPVSSGREPESIEIKLASFMHLYRHLVVYNFGKETTQFLRREVIDENISDLTSPEYALHLFAGSHGVPSVGSGLAIQLNAQERTDLCHARGDRRLKKGSTKLGEPRTVREALEAADPNAGARLGATPKPSTPLVLVAHEEGALPSALGRWHDLTAGRESLLYVCSVDYPMRSYHIRQLVEANGDLNVLMSRLQPLTPKPKGGVREFLATLYHALAEDVDADRGRGLTRETISERFLSRLPPELINGIGVPSSRLGLLELFGQFEFRVQIAIVAEGPSRRYRIEGAPATRTALDFDVPVLGEAGGEIAGERVSGAEIGLTVLPGVATLLQGKPVRYRSVSQTSITVETQGINALQRALPTVSIRLANAPNATSPRVQGGSAASEPTFRLPSGWIDAGGASAKDNWHMRHYYGFFERTTSGALVFERGSDPLGKDARLEHLPLVPVLTVRRLYQSVIHLRFNSVASQSPRDQVAFSVAAVLQDVIRAEFPRFGHRVHVVSPQASPLFDKARARTGDIPSTSSDTASDVERVNLYLLHRYAHLVSHVAAPPPAPAAEPRPETLDVLIVEDSDSDLGIAHAIAGATAHLLGKARAFAEWVAEKEGGDNRFHRFGAAVAPDILRWSDVVAVLRRAAGPVPVVAVTSGSEKLALVSTGDGDAGSENEKAA